MIGYNAHVASRRKSFSLCIKSSTEVHEVVDSLRPLQPGLAQVVQARPLSNGGAPSSSPPGHRESSTNSCFSRISFARQCPHNQRISKSPRNDLYPNLETTSQQQRKQRLDQPRDPKKLRRSAKTAAHTLPNGQSHLQASDPRKPPQSPHSWCSVAEAIPQTIQVRTDRHLQLQLRSPRATSSGHHGAFTLNPTTNRSHLRPDDR